MLKNTQYLRSFFFFFFFPKFSDARSAAKAESPRKSEQILTFINTFSSDNQTIWILVFASQNQ